MSISIEIYGPALACVVTTPSLIRRLFGARTTERFAVRLPSIGGDFIWAWDGFGGLVSADVLSAITNEVRHQRRPRARAVEPPG